MIKDKRTNGNSAIGKEHFVKEQMIREQMVMKKMVKEQLVLEQLDNRTKCIKTNANKANIVTVQW